MDPSASDDGIMATVKDYIRLSMRELLLLVGVLFTLGTTYAGITNTLEALKTTTREQKEAVIALKAQVQELERLLQQHQHDRKGAVIR